MNSEGKARDEHVLYELRGRDQILQLEVEDPLKSLYGEGPQLRQLAQDAREVVGLFLRFRVVGDMVSKGTYDLHL